MKNNILLVVLTVLFFGCKNPNCNYNKNAQVQKTIVDFHKTGQPFIEFGDSINKPCNICEIDKVNLKGNRWRNRKNTKAEKLEAMFITSVISGGKLTCFKINGNAIGPIPALAPGQVFPLNLYVPKDTLIEI
jgi:hypothetical protein